MRGQTVSLTGIGAFRFAQIVATKGPTVPLFPRFARTASPKSAANAALPLPLAGGVPTIVLLFPPTMVVLLAGWLVWVEIISGEKSSDRLVLVTPGLATPEPIGPCKSVAT